MFPGHVTVGVWVSATVSVMAQLAAVPILASLAWQVTVLVPFGKVEPLGGVQLAVEPGQLSLGGAEERRGGESRLSGAVVVVMFAGQVTVGGGLSVTVTVKVQLGEVLPLASVAW